MASRWFETVAEAQRRAKKRLPPSVYSRAASPAPSAGCRIDDNLAAFGELGFAPHVAGQSAERRLSTTIMGMEIGAAGDHLADRRAGRAPRR